MTKPTPCHPFVRAGHISVSHSERTYFDIGYRNLRRHESAKMQVLLPTPPPPSPLPPPPPPHPRFASIPKRLCCNQSELSPALVHWTNRAFTLLFHKCGRFVFFLTLMTGLNMGFISRISQVQSEVKGNTHKLGAAITISNDALVRKINNDC